MKYKTYINGVQVKAGFKPDQRRDRSGKWTNEPDPKHEWETITGIPAWHMALKHYVNSPQRLNQQLMDGEEYISEKWLMERLDYALTRLPKHKGLTFRGISLHGSDLEDFLTDAESGELLFKAFTSTSKSYSFAKEWDWNGMVRGIKVLMRVNGRSGRDISEITNHINKGEVLFPRNTKWDVGPIRELLDEDTGEFYYDLEITEI